MRAMSLATELADLPEEMRARLAHAGFDEARWLELAGSIRTPEARRAREEKNRVTGDVRPPAPGVIARVRAEDEARLRTIGRDALSRGELAFIVMAGGMATRMGGVVKALVVAFEGKTFLDLRLGENRSLTARCGAEIPLWLMTSEATHAGITGALEKAGAGPHVRAFTQDLSLRMTREGGLFRDHDGLPSVYATGHGDLVDAVRRSGYLDAFLTRGGKYVWIANLDNLGATVDDAILGHFIETGKDVMVEVCDKVGSDRGGIPVSVDGKVQVLEEFRLPPGFDASAVRVFNTNTFLVRADALARATIPWNWFYVEKKADGGVAVQFERLLQELTSALPSAYLGVPREGDATRFLPVKDHDELAARRADIERIARARGMV